MELFPPCELTSDDIVGTPIPNLFASAEPGGLTNAQHSLVYFSANDIIHHQDGQKLVGTTRERLVQSLMQFAFVIEKSKQPYSHRESK